MGVHLLRRQTVARAVVRPRTRRVVTLIAVGIRAGGLALWLAMDLLSLLGLGVVQTRVINHAVYFRVELLPRATGFVRGSIVLLAGSILATVLLRGNMRLRILRILRLAMSTTPQSQNQQTHHGRLARHCARS